MSREIFILVAFVGVVVLRTSNSMKGPARR
jgi:hypothetical protein